MCEWDSTEVRMIPWGAKTGLWDWRYVYSMYNEKCCKLGRYYSHGNLSFLYNH